MMMVDSNIFGMHDVYIRRPVLRDISDSPLGRGWYSDIIALILNSVVVAVVRSH